MRFKKIFYFLIERLKHRVHRASKRKFYSLDEERSFKRQLEDQRDRAEFERFGT